MPKTVIKVGERLIELGQCGERVGNEFLKKEWGHIFSGIRVDVSVTGVTFQPRQVYSGEKMSVKGSVEIEISSWGENLRIDLMDGSEIKMKGVNGDVVVRRELD